MGHLWTGECSSPRRFAEGEVRRLISSRRLSLFSCILLRRAKGSKHHDTSGFPDASGSQKHRQHRRECIISLHSSSPRLADLACLACLAFQVNHRVRPDSRLTLSAIRTIVSEEGFDELLDGVRARIDEVRSPFFSPSLRFFRLFVDSDLPLLLANLQIESLHRTSEVRARLLLPPLLSSPLSDLRPSLRLWFDPNSGCSRNPSASVNGKATMGRPRESSSLDWDRLETTTRRRRAGGGWAICGSCSADRFGRRDGTK